MKPNTRRKSIAYAYPTSTNAEYFGMSATGCYYVQETMHNIEGSGQVRTGIHPQADSEGFLSVDDTDLQALFRECKGEICPMSAKLRAHYYQDSTKGTTAYAIKTNKGYLAVQGNECWFQDEPKGGALYATEEDARDVGEPHHSMIGTKPEEGYTLEAIALATTGSRGNNQ